MPDAIGVGLTQTPATQPLPQVAPAADPASQWVTLPTNQLSVTPVTNVPMGPSAPTHYTSGQIQLDPQSYTGATPNQLGGGGSQQGASAISNFVYGMESNYGKGAQINQQKYPSMVDYNYGQYPEFGKQYGTGQAGVDNYAAQVLKANPNATIGDFYSSYVLNTGDPSKLSTPDQLKANNPVYYQNLVNSLNAHGYNFNTPLSTLVGTQGAQATGVGPGGEVMFGTPTQTPTSNLQPAQWPQSSPQSVMADANAPTQQSVAAQASKQMQQMALMAALRGFQLHPVPYDPAAVLKVSHIYGQPDTRFGGLPQFIQTPQVQKAQPVSALYPSVVPGRLGQRGPQYQT